MTWRLPVLREIYVVGKICMEHIPKTCSVFGWRLAWINKDNGGWLLGNVNYEGFYRVNYQESMWAKLTKQLREDHTVSTVYFFDNRF